MSALAFVCFTLVAIVGFHAALFLFLILRFVFGFLWAMAGYYAAIAAVCFALLQISA